LRDLVQKGRRLLALEVDEEGGISCGPYEAIFTEDFGMKRDCKLHTAAADTRAEGTGSV
jgi:hypothetical protein